MRPCQLPSAPLRPEARPPSPLDHSLVVEEPEQAQSAGSSVCGRDTGHRSKGGVAPTDDPFPPPNVGAASAWAGQHVGYDIAWAGGS
jgi:hypothetical protein